MKVEKSRGTVVIVIFPMNVKDRRIHHSQQQKNNCMPGNGFTHRRILKKRYSEVNRLRPESLRLDIFHADFRDELVRPSALRVDSKCRQRERHGNSSHRKEME